MDFLSLSFGGFSACPCGPPQFYTGYERSYGTRIGVRRRETFLNDIHNSGFEKIGHEAFEIHMIRA